MWRTAAVHPNAPRPDPMRSVLPSCRLARGRLPGREGGANDAALFLARAARSGSRTRAYGRPHVPLHLLFPFLFSSFLVFFFSSFFFFFFSFSFYSIFFSFFSFFFFFF